MLVMLKIVNSYCFVKGPHHVHTIQLHVCLLVNEFLGALSRNHIPWRQDVQWGYMKQHQQVYIFTYCTYIYIHPEIL